MKTKRYIGALYGLLAAPLLGCGGGESLGVPTAGPPVGSVGGATGGGAGALGSGGSGQDGIGGTPAGSGGGVEAGAGGGGSPGAGGGSGAAGSVPFFIGEGTWVDGAANLAGLQGSFFLFEDGTKDDVIIDDGLVHTDLDPDTGGTSAEEPSKFDDLTEKPCVSGAVAWTTKIDGTSCAKDVAACEWDAIFGGGIGLTLSETGGDDSVKSTWSAVDHGVTGFQFSLSGDIGGATLRFKATDETHAGEDFCYEVPVGPDIRVDLADLTHMCWGRDGTEELDTTALLQIQWQLVADQDDAHDVSSFCVDAVSSY